MRSVKYKIVVSAAGKVRVAKNPRLYADEVAIPLTLRFPDNWGRTLTDKEVVITVPDFTPEVVHEIEEPVDG